MTAPVAVTGLGVVTSIARDERAFAAALSSGRTGIIATESSGVGAPCAAVTPEEIATHCDDGSNLKGILRRLSDAGRRSLLVAAQAHRDANLDGRVSQHRIGLVVSGTNLTSPSLLSAAEAHTRSANHVNPMVALTMLDNFQLGAISEVLGIRGPGLLVGAASGSGNAAIAAGMRLLHADEVDACIVVGSSPDLTPPERAAFVNIGAMAQMPSFPFSADRCGFVAGDGAAAVVMEVDGAENARARVLAAASLLDATTSSAPSVDGEVESMQLALQRANVAPSAVDYVNAHGSGSSLGDRTEAEALAKVFGGDAPVANSTKALVGHCLGASGLVELVATVLQIEGGFIHPNLGVSDPDLAYDSFAGDLVTHQGIRIAVSNSFGFCGFNSSIVIERNTSCE